MDLIAQSVSIDFHIVKIGLTLKIHKVILKNRFHEFGLANLVGSYSVKRHCNASPRLTLPLLTTLSPWTNLSSRR